MIGRRTWNDHELPKHIGRHSPDMVRVLSGPVLALLRVLHRCEAEGFENLPDGPFLLVANHPPCTGSAEFLSFAALWARRFAGDRPLAGFVHTAGYGLWPLSWLFRQVGAIPSTYIAAEAALQAGVPLLIFPGGDHEACKPFWQSRTDFGGRQGFLRIARKAGVPIVPMALEGNAAPVLVRCPPVGWLIVWPRLFGIKTWGITVLGAVVAILLAIFLPGAWYMRALLTYAWLASPFSMMPWLPLKVRCRIGAPMLNTSSVADVERAIDALHTSS